MGNLFKSFNVVQLIAARSFPLVWNMKSRQRLVGNTSSEVVVDLDVIGSTRQCAASNNLKFIGRTAC